MRILDLKAEEVLEKAKERLYEQSLMDAEDDNILNVLNREYDEAHTHSKIIYYLLTRPERRDKAGSFLVSFLKHIGVHEEYIDSKWTIYRERVFDEGRIDFVLESSDYVAAIEMKLGAEDGIGQLERYDRFCKSRRKRYGLYYLTIDGGEPSEQSVGKLDREYIQCISFEKDILNWLYDCLSFVPYDGYKYSLIKQYIAAVERITCKGTDFNMDKLIEDSETAFAVVDLYREFQNKMADVMLRFIEGVKNYVSDKGGYECVDYDLNGDDFYFSVKKTTPGFYVLLDSVEVGIFTYRFYFYTEITENLYFGFAFDRIKKGNDEEEGVEMEKMKGKELDFYNNCTDRIDAIHVWDLKKDKGSWWAYIENTKGEKLDFKHWSNSVIELIDDTDIQVEYIGDYLVNKILKRV